MNYYTLIKPFGIITYVLLFSVVVSGLMGVKLKHHKLLAAALFAAATLHGLIVLLWS